MFLHDARLKAAQALRLLQEDYCTVYVKQKATDPDGFTTNKEVAKYRNIPCRISFSNIPHVNQGDTPEKEQEVKVFLSPEYIIPPGCVIEVTRLGKRTAYKCSGEPAIYPTHQEINLELEETHA